MVTARKLARYILYVAHERNIEVTPQKLQALLYYCQGYSLALTGKPAFSDPIEAWPPEVEDDGNSI